MIEILIIVVVLALVTISLEVFLAIIFWVGGYLQRRF